MPSSGDRANGGPFSRANVAVFWPVLATTRVFWVVSPTGQNPKSIAPGVVTFRDEICEQTRTANFPASVRKTIASSYGSRRIGRNRTSSATNVPGESVRSCGNSIEKNFVFGSSYLIFTVFTETFFTMSFFTYSPPGSHRPAFQSRESTQSTPNCRDRDDRERKRGGGEDDDDMGEREGRGVVGRYLGFCCPTCNPQVKN